MTGLSLRNLNHTRAFAAVYPDPQFVQQVFAQIAWGHYLHCHDFLRTPDHRHWHARQVTKQDWSRAVIAGGVSLVQR